MKARSNDLGKDEVTIISAGVSIEGKLNSNGNVRIDGEVKGDINASGKVTGAIHSKEKLVLESKALLKGDLVTKILVVEAGAKFEGNSSMGGAETTKIPGQFPEQK